MNTENLVMTEAGIGSTYNSFKLTKEEEKQIDKDINYFESKADKYGFVTSWCLYEIRALSFKSPFKGKWMTDGIRNEIKIPLPNRRLTGLELWRYADELFHKVSEIKGESNHCFIEDFQFNEDTDTIEVGFGS